MRSPAKLLLLTAGLLVFLIASTWLVVREITQETAGAPSLRQEAHWSFHPDHPPDPTSRTLVVLANDLQCASGIPPEDRLFPPKVDESSDAVVITFSARMTPGGVATCPGHQPVTRRIILTEPIGDRRLLDGWYSPPRTVDEDTQI